MTSVALKARSIIQPIVEGQLRGFVKEHPTILDGVIWYKPKTNKEDVFVNSVAKRITNDLTSDETIGRLAASLLEITTGNDAEAEAVAVQSAAPGDGSGKCAGPVPGAREGE